MDAFHFSEEEELEWDKYYDSLWSLIGYIKLDISSGRLVVGNALLPSMMVLSFENYTCKLDALNFSEEDETKFPVLYGHQCGN